MKKSIYPLILITSNLLSGCSTVMENLPGVYTLDIQQGNIISQDLVDQLRPKMTKRQVLYIMGSSMLVDVFHQKRWDYLYSEQLGGEARQQKRLSLFFDGDQLAGVQGDFKLSSLAIPKKSNTSTVDVPPREFDKTLWEKITGIFSDDDLQQAPEIAESSVDDIDEEPVNDNLSNILK